MTKVVFHYQAGPALASRLEALAAAGLDVAIVDPADEEGLETVLAEAEILWHVLRPATRAMIEAAPRLRLIQKIGVGVNTIDLEAAAERGIAVANMPGTNTQAVAEMTLALMLACLRRLPTLDRAVRAGEGWRLPASMQDGYGEIAGRTVGLLGYGAVPCRLAPILEAMGAAILHHTRSAKPAARGEPVSLEALLERSDILSLHIPLDASTERIIGERAIARMPAGAILVNTARGGLVDEPALIAALKSGHLRAAGLDVFAVEPIAADNPLLALENVVLAPHVAWLTPETLGRSLEVAIDNARRLVEGEPILNRVV